MWILRLRAVGAESASIDAQDERKELAKLVLRNPQNGSILEDLELLSQKVPPKFWGNRPKQAVLEVS